MGIPAIQNALMSKMGRMAIARMGGLVGGLRIAPACEKTRGETSTSAAGAFGRRRPQRESTMWKGDGRGEEVLDRCLGGWLVLLRCGLPSSIVPDVVCLMKILDRCSLREWIMLAWVVTRHFSFEYRTPGAWAYYVSSPVVGEIEPADMITVSESIEKLERFTSKKHFLWSSMCVLRINVIAMVWLEEGSAGTRRYLKALTSKHAARPNR